ncbi:MAG: xanthine dehydrogenase family protein subunit M [Candidatus Aminicenantes bacterium]|nr:MAG: xanthine dehydrogenase family protein subunit M [Candidatus Aminicenantes bacterium]
MYEIDIISPKTVGEALELKNERGEVLHPIAGGTDVLVSVYNNRVDWGSRPSLLNLSRIEELHFIRETSDSVEIGPLVTHREIIENPVIATHVPALSKAVSFIGSPQIRNQGTIGGNIVNASPAADSLPVLYARDAMIEVSTLDGKALLPIREFIKGPGLVDLDPAGIVTKIVVPRLSGYFGDYLSLRQRKAISINVVSLGAEMLVSNDGVIEDVRVAFGAVSPTVVRGVKTEQLLRNRKRSSELVIEAVDLVQSECVPIDDIRSNKMYRGAMAGVLLQKFLQSI